MKAIQLDGPGPPEALHIRDLPVPVPPQGWVPIRVEAFGLNRSELHLRHGFATNVTFPRVPGIECAGTIEDPTTTFDHPLLDNGAITTAIREIAAAGVDAVLELVGTNTLRDSLRATRVHGTVCSTGMVSNEWTIRDFYPIEYIPTGVRLTSYGGDAADLPREVLQRYLNDVAEGRMSVPIHRVFEMDEIEEAHRTMESNAAMGKMVVRVKH